MTISRAILSVYDKAGLPEFARALVDHGVELIASGGTAAAIRQAGLPVKEVSDVTGVPEILSGRLKTLHPAIHGGILSRRTAADRDDLHGQGWNEIDLVVVNLQPFEKTAAIPDKTQADIIEKIDVGGSALLASAAMNFAHVTVICYPTDYATVLEEIETHREVPLETRRQLAARAFSRIASYDAAIRDFLALP